MAVPIIALTSLIGYFLNKKENPKIGSREIRSNQPIKNNLAAFELPNGKYIYSSNVVNEANDEILNKSLDLYKQAENPSMTGVLPPLFNTYGASGKNLYQENFSDKLHEIDTVNRLVDVVKPEEPLLDKRPMFESDIKFKGDLIQQNFSAFDQTPINQEISLLTGQPLEKMHSNMVPFFGGNMKQNIETFTNETILDLHSGNTSTFKHKQETGEFFKNRPENIYGAPVFTTQVETDRYIPSLFKQNEKPFEDKKVQAPISGTIDNTIRPTFKDVNELRPGNKPKETYEVRGVQAEVNKNRPDTFYEQGSDRLLVTTGQHIAKKSDEDYSTNFKPTSREDYNLEYYGPMGTSEFLVTKQRMQSMGKIDNSNELNINSLVQMPKRYNFENDYTRNLSGDQKRVNDYGKNSITAFETERTTTSDKSHLLNPTGVMGGIKTRFSDNAKSTIKETTLDTDPTRNLKSSFDKGLIESHYSGISDFVAKTTNKETIKEDNYKGVMQKEQGMGYLVNKYEAKTTGKELVTMNSEYQGNATYANNPTSKENYLNAVIRDSKQELLERDRLAGPQNFQISSGKNAFGDIKFTENMELKESLDTRDNLNLLYPNIFPSKFSLGISDRVRYDEDVEDTVFADRMDSNIISSQFNENPYSIYGNK
jgi:hypothetical protein